MGEEVATIELPRGDPVGVSDAGAALARVGGGFDRAGGAVGAAVSAVGSWEGSASVAFRDRAAGYEQALGSVDGVLAQARGALRRYEGELEQARGRVRGLRREEEECLQRLELEQRRVRDAAQRAAGARDRVTQATFASGLGGDPFSLAAQAGAQRDLEEADGDARRAERAVQRERDELDRLRRKAARERERVKEAERSAAAAVRQAAGDLPDVRLPTGEVSPPALAGAPSGVPIDLSGVAPLLPLSALGGGGQIPAGGRLKVPDPGESPVDRLFGRDYVSPEEAANVVFENGVGSGVARALGRIIGVGARKIGPPRTRLTPGGGLRAHEGPGKGHTLAKHVGLGDGSLARRLAAEPNLKSASSFADRALAEDAVSGTLSVNRMEVEAFAKSGGKPLVLEQEFDRSVGRTLGRGETQAQGVNRARVVLVKDESELGYHVLTAYPIP